MTTPPGLFAPGGRTGIPKERVFGLIPIQWLEAHPATRRWQAKVTRSTVPAAEVVDQAINLQDGFEGLIRFMSLLGKADTQGANQGIGWRIFFDKVPAVETTWGIANGVAPLTLDQSGRFDYIVASDGQGRSWGELNYWVPNGSQVAVGMNNNGGTVDPMGWTMWGIYWPITLHEEWSKRGWRGT